MVCGARVRQVVDALCRGCSAAAVVARATATQAPARRRGLLRSMDHAVTASIASRVSSCSGANRHPLRAAGAGSADQRGCWASVGVDAKKMPVWQHQEHRTRPGA